MAAVANDQRIELVVDGRAFQKRVKIIRETIELEFLGLTPFDLIGGFCKEYKTNNPPFLLNIRAFTP